MSGYAIQCPAGRKLVEHDGVRIEPGSFDLVNAVLLQNVVPDLGLGPIVGRPAKIANDFRLVPLNAAIGVLMLVSQADRMPELVGRRSAVQEARG